MLVGDELMSSHIIAWLLEIKGGRKLAYRCLCLISEFFFFFFFGFCFDFPLATFMTLFTVTTIGFFGDRINFESYVAIGCLMCCVQLKNRGA